ncbi:MAG: pectinesterase family protein [Bacteroidales bacterium]|nr:pectinesterase family protein [Bacteroidales bacterium]
MNGVLDPSGTTTFSTVGSATVTVAEQATGFYAANITFRNYWNTNALYNDALKITSSTQADAAYVNADRVHFYNVTFTGYHDTLEAENGRQYYEHCYIEGRTDYIFGNTATCYFYQCNIHTIGAGSSTNGGYVTAVKGGSMTYGYVFDGCNFTSDLESYYGEGEGKAAVPYDGFEYTVAGTVSLGRTWSSADMHVAVLNSTFDAGYSTKAYGDSSDSKNARYGSMSGYAPTPAYLVEYNNSGAGAITTDLADTCSMLTADQAASYTIENIFAATNGGMSYGSGWNPSTETTITVTVEDGSGNEIAKIYATGSISVSDLVEAVNARLTDAQVYDVYSAATFDDSTLITEDIATTTTVYVKLEEKDMTVPESVSYDFSGTDYGSITESGWLDYMYFEVQDGGSFSSNNGGWYQLQSATLTVKLSAGSSIEFEVYSQSSITVDEGENVTVTVTDAVSGESNWFYRYTVSEATELTFGAAENAQLYIRQIIITVPVVYGIGNVIRFDDVDSSDSSYNVSYGETGIFKGVTIDATALTGTGTAFRNNGNSFQVAVGVVFEIQSVPGATVTITFYGSGYEFRYTAEADENGLIKITVTEVDTNGGYIKTIQIIENTNEVIYDVGDSITFEGVSGSDYDVEGAVGYYEGLTIDATNGKFANNNNSFLIGVGTIITIQSVPYATAEVDYYEGYGGTHTVVTDESGVITITFTAADNGTIYIKGINIVVKPYEIGDVINLVTGNEQGSFQINGTTGSYEGIEVDATNGGKFFDNGNSFQVNANTVLKIQSIA